jgi:hypothetical protein
MMHQAVTKRGLLWTCLALLSTVAFSFPFFWLSFSNYSYLALAHETLAYRYFFNLRILDGQGSAVWLPQGQLLSSLQTGILLVLNGLFGLSLVDLKGILSWYGLLSNLLVISAYFCVALIAAHSRALNWFDRCLVLMTAPLVVLGTGFAGFYYTALPDYLALNQVFVAAATYLALVQIRSQGPFAWKNMILAGVFCGLAASNKLTLAGPAGIPLLLIALAPPLTSSRFILRCAVGGASAAGAFLFVFWACYLFDGAAMARALQHWLRFLFHAPAELGGFWERNFSTFLRIYNYGFIIAVFILSLLALTVTIAVRHAWFSKAGAMLFGILLVGALLGGGLLKRGAGTTLFEACAMLVALSALCLAVSFNPRRNIRTCMVIVASASPLRSGNSITARTGRSPQDGAKWNARPGRYTTSPATPA